MHINHNNVHNVLIQKYYVPSEGTKWFWKEIYQDAEGTTRINVKTPQDHVTYLNALEKFNVMHNYIEEEVHDPQENLQEQVTPVSFKSHEEEDVQNNIAGLIHYLQENLLPQIIPASSIVHKEKVVDINNVWQDHDPKENVPEQIITDNLIVYEEISSQLSKSYQR